MEATEVSICLKKSSRLTRRYPPRRPTFQHPSENGEQFTHAGRQHEFLRFPHLTERLIEGPNRRIPPRGRELVHLVSLV